MRRLPDTHILLWALIEPERLGAEVRGELEDPEHEMLFSAASVWEMASKAAFGRADFQISPATILQHALAAGFVELQVRSAAALWVANLPLHHRDPFDRLLVAQALTEPAALYTANAQSAAYSELVVLV